MSSKRHLPALSITLLLAAPAAAQPAILDPSTLAELAYLAQQEAEAAASALLADDTAPTPNDTIGNVASITQNDRTTFGVARVNVGIIDQQGDFGAASIVQIGSANQAAIQQQEDADLATAAIDQTGLANFASTVQSGLGSASRVTQSGGTFGFGYHLAYVRQFDASLSTLRQLGSNHLAIIDQSGPSNVSDIAQRDLGSDAGDEIVFTAGVFQTGEANESALRQDADIAGGFGSVVQTGDGNRTTLLQFAAAAALVYQEGDSNVSAIVQRAGAAASLADVEQLGRGGVSSLDQDGRRNVATLFQARGSEMATSDVLQSGPENSAEIFQGGQAISSLVQRGTSNFASVTQFGALGQSWIVQDGQALVVRVTQ